MTTSTPMRRASTRPKAVSGDGQITGLRLISIAALMGAAVGLLIPWASAFIVSVNGINTDDGKLFGAILVVAALLTWWRFMRTGRLNAVLLIVALLGLLAISIYEIVHIPSSSSNLVSVGSGLYVDAAGASIGSLAAIIDASRYWSESRSTRQTKRRPTLVVVGAIAVLLAIAAVVIIATRKTTPTPTTAGRPLTIAAAGQAYLGAVNTLDSSCNAFSSKAQSWTSDTSNAQAESDAQPCISAIRNLQQTLLNTNWPSTSHQDVASLAAGIDPLVADLQGLGTLNFLNESSWLTKYERDGATVHTASAIVRHDFGLPAAS